MAYVITSKCIGTCDTACMKVCPVDCIAGPGSVDELGAQLFIDPDLCTNCGACAAECPVDAIFDEDALPAGHERDRERNAEFFRRRG